MTREELREKVAEEMWQADMVRAMGQRRSVPWAEAGPAAHRQWLSVADAAIALIRGETLEEAARVVWADRVKDPYKDGDYGWNAAMEAAAAAIRALKGKP